MKIKIIGFTSIVTLLVGCSMSPLSVEVSPEAKNIQVTNSKPIGNYELIAPISVSNGKGCRDFGYLGTKEDAIATLKNKTSEIRGDYAQITAITKPHLDGGCYDNRYTIMALVYRKNSSAPTKSSHIDTSNEEVFTKKMRELKSLFDDGVITKQEYANQKKKLLDKGFNTK